MSNNKKKKAHTRNRFKADIRELTLQAGKEYTHLLAYAARELSGTGHKRPKCTLKKGWFDH